MTHSRIKDYREERILFSALNWGLGHVMRSLPVLKQLQQQNNELFIACNEEQKKYFSDNLNDVNFIHLEGYPLKFCGNGNWGIEMLRNMPSLLLHMIRERKTVELLIKEKNISVVLSDQRFGFRSKSVHSILITHQLQLALPRCFQAAQWMNKQLWLSFDEIWIPDSPSIQLAGDLTNGEHPEKYWIGMQSHITEIESNKETTFLAIISGPSPYREEFYDIVLAFLKKQNTQSVIIAPGSLNRAIVEKEANINEFRNPTPQEFSILFHSAKRIISRTGYTTLMDLQIYQKSAILIPTKGQYEQLYLAQRHCNHPLWEISSEEDLLVFYSVNQEKS